MWGPRSIAKLVHITPMTMVYGTQITIVNGVYKPTYNWGAPHCVYIYIYDFMRNSHWQKRLGCHLQKHVVAGASRAIHHSKTHVNNYPLVN